MKIWRKHKEDEVVVLPKLKTHLVPRHLYNRIPKYYVYGGLVFTVLSKPYLESEFGNDWAKVAPLSFCAPVFDGTKKAVDHEIVVLNTILISDLTVGYDDIAHLILLKVNGEPIESLKQVVSLVEESKEPFVRFDLEFGK